MIFELFLNKFTVATNKPQTLNSLNGKVFKRYKNNKRIGLGYSRDERSVFSRLRL